MRNNNHEWLNRCFNCMEPLDSPDAVCANCGWDNHNRENGNAMLEQTILNDQYIIGKSLGRGGFGITYVGFDLTLERRVAIKEYFPVGMAYRFSDAVTVRAYTEAEEDYQSGLKQALQESRTIAKLGQIPNIMQVHNAFRENGTVYMVMEYIDGNSLAEEVKQKGRIDWKEALHLLYPLMDALEKIHEKGVIHRDISPENIILRRETGAPVLLDFGSARPQRQGLTVMLKPGYAPMEQYSSNSEQDGRVDEYALCATMYYLVTGTAPVPADLRQFAKKELKRPSEYAGDIPVEFEEVLLKGMEPDSSNRYASMRELHEAFSKAEQEAGKIHNSGKSSKSKKKTDSTNSAHTGNTTNPGSKRPEKKENHGGSGKAAGIIAAAAVVCLGGFLLFGNGSHDKDAEKKAVENSTEESVTEEKAEVESEATPMPEPEDVVSAGKSEAAEEPAETATPEPTATYTATPEPTATYTPTAEPTATNTPTPEPTATNTPTPEPTATNTPTPEPTATNTPTPEPTATNTPTPEPTATNTPTPEPTATNTPTPEPVPENLPQLKGYFTQYEDQFLNGFRRDEITEVKVEKSLAGAPGTARDVSEAGDGSVLSWVTVMGEEKILTIAGEGGVRAPESMYSWFSGYHNLRKAVLDGLDTSNVTDMSWMFWECETLTSIDISNLNTSSVEHMQGLFRGCEALENIDVSNLDTSNVTIMEEMFRECKSLVNIDVSNFDTSNVKNMSNLFSECESLANIDVSSFDTSNVTDMSSMFSKCESLINIDVSNFDTSNVTNMTNMFYRCESLTSVDVSGFDTSNVIDMNNMFFRCKNLTSIGTSNFDTSQANTTNMFMGCDKL